MLKDLSKYDRLFTFGCSFTEYCYPTWANILSKSMPNAEHLNLGRCGAGNQYIAMRMTEVNNKFKFCDTDLVVTLWTTHCREDRYVNQYWHTPGNIFTQTTYPASFVKEFSDPIGYLIRDLSIIETATGYINSLPCDYVGLTSVPFRYDIGDDNIMVDEILDVYKNTVASFPPSLLDLGMGGTWDDSITYKMDDGSTRTEYHPGPLDYYRYLDLLGFNLSDEAKQYAKDSDRIVRDIGQHSLFNIMFPELRVHREIPGMW